MDNILEVKKLNIAIKNKILVKNISFTMQPSKILAIVGESGSGKSILSKAILRLNNEKYFSYPQGKILFKKNNILSKEATYFAPNKDIKIQQATGILRKLLGKNLGLIMQDPFLSLNPVQDIKKQIAETLIKHKLNKKLAIKTQVNKMLIEVGLESLCKIKKTYPHQLSGGQKQRVMIALSLISKPELLIADEPTTALDPKTQNEILDLLLKLKKKYNLALIFISHDLSLVKKIADKILVLSQGNIVEYNSSQEIFNNPKHPYTKKLINSHKFNLTKNKIYNQKIITIKNICASYKKGGFFIKQKQPIIENANLEIYKGETIGLIGSSGCGKSTLARILLRLQNSDSGQIIFAQNDITKLKQSQLRYLRKDMQIIFQDPFATLNPKMTIYQILKEGLIAHKIVNHDDIIISAIKEVGLKTEYLARFPNQFSGGQRQRIAIARAISLAPRFIILDEPTASLDVMAQKEILELLINLQKKHYISYLFISHNYDIIRAMSHRYFVLKDKRLQEFKF